MTEITRQVTFRLPEEVWQALRTEAYIQEKTNTQIILEALAVRLAAVVPPAQTKLFPRVVEPEPESFFVDPG